MKTVLVTGGAGFIGSHYIRHVLQNHPDLTVINADALTYSGHLYNLKDIETHPCYRFVQMDLANRDHVEALFSEPIDEVVHFAAESHVDRSIRSAEPFIRSNIMGTFHLLEVAKQAGVKRFVHVSTDEVYGSIPEGTVDEHAPLNPSNPYSASKASSDLLCLAYHRTHGLPVIITRCTNNYGPCQYPEKLIPLLIRRLMKHQPLPLYGDGRQERDWIHVKDHCRGVDLVRQRGRAGEVYHIGAERTIPNLEIALSLCEWMGQTSDVIQFVEDRPGHDARYSLDTTKIRAELGFRPSIPFEQGLRETLEWYLEHDDWWESIENRKKGAGLTD